MKIYVSFGNVFLFYVGQQGFTIFAGALRRVIVDES